MRAGSLLPVFFSRNRSRPSKFLLPRVSPRTLYACIVIVALYLFWSLLDLPGLNFEFRGPPLFDFGPWGRSSGDPLVWDERARRVTAAFVSAYKAYEESAYPHDELLPKTNSSKDPLNGWGASLVDGLDTMVLMGLDDMYNRSIEHIAQLDFYRDQSVQFFETVIRYLGGLLSAFALTGEPVLLARADDLGKQLLPVFNTTLGLPAFGVNLVTGKTRNGWMGTYAILSEMASCQMEYRYLAHLTGRPEYVHAVDRITDFLKFRAEKGGLFPLTYDLTRGYPFAHTYSVGGLADSAYEYLLKQWLMTGRTEQRYLDMYLKSADAIITNMLYLSPARQLLYASDIVRPSRAPLGEQQHLACFLAGLLALGAAAIPPPHADPRHAWAAQGLAHTCWLTYAESRSGLGPEHIAFPAPGRRWVDALDEWDAHGARGPPPGTGQARAVWMLGSREYRITDGRYMLRPETLESLYILWRTTGDRKWRDRGWAIFEAIEKHAKEGRAFASVQHVDHWKWSVLHMDDLPSFFFAETLKYAYLLCRNEDILPLDQWTFNTEAHPIPNFVWSEWEKSAFDIKA